MTEACAVDDIAENDEVQVSTEDDPRAIEHERCVRKEMDDQFVQLKDESQALFGRVKGRPGVQNPAERAKMLEEAGDEIGNGRFIVRCLGAERYLEPETVAVLLTLRQSLISEQAKATAADIMQIDAAIIAYYNMLRVQGWIGNMALVIERQLFGQDPINSLEGGWPEDGVERRFQRLSENMLPLLDRSQRMMGRSLSGLSSNRTPPRSMRSPADH